MLNFPICSNELKLLNISLIVWVHFCFFGDNISENKIFKYIS